MENLIIYGAGKLGKSIYSMVKDKYNVVAILDKNEAIHHTRFEDVEIIYPWENTDDVFLGIACVVCGVCDTFIKLKSYLETLGFKKVYWYGEILKSVYNDYDIMNIWKLDSSYHIPDIEWGDEKSILSFRCAVEWFLDLSEDTINVNPTIVEKNQHYNTKILGDILTSNDVIVDCCCLSGEYIELYGREIGFRICYGFIHNPNIIDKDELESRFQNCNVIFENLELSDKKGRKKTIRLAPMIPYNSTKVYTVDTITADEYFEKIPYTFMRVYSMSPSIKVLQGAAKTIKRYRPIIAVNIGHYKEDFMEIPSFLKRLDNYCMLFRIHEFQGGSCIIYAIPRERMKF